MVQPRPRRIRPPRLKRAMQRYIKAMRRQTFIRGAIAHIAKVRREHPGQENHAALWLPRWVRQMALDATLPPEPDLWSFYWRGRGQKNQGRPACATVAEDAPAPAPAPTQPSRHPAPIALDPPQASPFQAPSA